MHLEKNCVSQRLFRVCLECILTTSRCLCAALSLFLCDCKPAARQLQVRSQCRSPQSNTSLCWTSLLLRLAASNKSRGVLHFTSSEEHVSRGDLFRAGGGEPGEELLLLLRVPSDVEMSWTWCFNGNEENTRIDCVVVRPLDGVISPRCVGLSRCHFPDLITVCHLLAKRRCSSLSTK